MKKSISPLVIGAVAFVAVVVLVALFMKSNTVQPTASNLPDYATMTPEQIAKQKEDSMQAERGNARPK